jgi:hypothetical protein
MAATVTLELDEALAKKAEAWATAQGLSVSDAITRLIASLPEPRSEPELSPWVRSIAGTAVPVQEQQFSPWLQHVLTLSASVAGRIPSDEEIWLRQAGQYGSGG